MKLLVAFALAAAMVLAVARADETYSTKYDNVDIDEILHSERLFKNYYNCLIDKGSCTPDARELKKTLPDALQTDCKKCTGSQKEKGEKVIHYVIDNKPDEWKVLQAKYDPQNTYFAKYQKSKG